jgi:hypothetical protein
MSVAMTLFELLQLTRIFLDHLLIEYFRHTPIMSPIKRTGITSVLAPTGFFLFRRYCERLSSEAANQASAEPSS